MKHKNRLFSYNAAEMPPSKAPAYGDVPIRSLRVGVDVVVTEVTDVEVRERVVDVAAVGAVGRVLERVHQAVNEARREGDQKRLT